MTNDVARLNLIEDMLVSRAKSTYSKRDREPVEAALEAFRRLRAMPRDADAAWAELKDVAGERDELRNRVEALTAEVKRLQDADSRYEHDIQQVLGKALGYPWYKDDQKNFPGSTEADGVCTGPHVAVTLADEAADRVEYLDWVAMVREVHLETVPEILRDTPGIPTGSLYTNYGLDFIREEVEELGQACYDGDLVEMVDALADIVYVSIRASLMLGVDMRPVFREVHRAMKTKYEGGLLKRADGKVLKGPNYVPPDIASVLDAQKRGAFD